MQKDNTNAKSNKQVAAAPSQQKDAPSKSGGCRKRRTVDTKALANVRDAISRRKYDEAWAKDAQPLTKFDDYQLLHRYVSALMVFGKKCPMTYEEIDRVSVFRHYAYKLIANGDNTLDDIIALYNQNDIISIGERVGSTRAVLSYRDDAPAARKKTCQEPIAGEVEAKEEPVVAEEDESELRIRRQQHKGIYVPIPQTDLADRIRGSEDALLNEHIVYSEDIRRKPVGKVDMNGAKVVYEETPDFAHMQKPEYSLFEDAGYDISLRSRKALSVQNEKDRQTVEKFYRNPTADAFKLIWDRFYYGVHSHISAFTGNWNRADDLTQETFQRAWEKRFFYDSRRSNYSTWLYTIARNLTFTKLKKSQKDKVIDVDVNDIFYGALYENGNNCMMEDESYMIIDDNGEVQDNTYDDITHKMFDASVAEIEKMEPLFQKIIELKNARDMTLRQIATELNMKVSKIKNCYYKNREMLVDCLKNEYSDLYSIYRDASHDKDLADSYMSAI